MFGGQRVSGQHWPLTLKSLTLWALHHIVAPILPRVLEHAIVWIGKSRVSKSPVSYTLSAITLAFWLLQEDRGHEAPPFQTVSHLDYSRKEEGRRTKPGTLPCVYVPASVVLVQSSLALVLNSDSAVIKKLCWLKSWTNGRRSNFLVT